MPVPEELSNVATFTRDSVPGSANQANIQPVYEVYASTQGRDLGSIASAIDEITTGLKPQLKPGNTIQVTGQIALGLEPGDEQNAALARAVIGGLLFATQTTLLVVPYLFALLRKGNDGKAAHGVFAEVPE
jgi:multidrug efflux pump subunit AcrB